MSDTNTAGIWPQRFTELMTTIYGPSGRAWLLGLPTRVEAAAQRWGLRLGPVIGTGYSALYRATLADGTPVLLKASFPARREVLRERAVLAAAAGRGMIRRYEHDDDQGLLVFQHARPGRPLTELAATDDEAATSVAAEVMARVWTLPIDPGLPSVTEMITDLMYYQRLVGAAGPVPPAMFDRAQRLFAALWSTSPETVLLHGDLHHGNIVTDGDDWLCIDPKGYVGERAFEPGALLINPMETVLTHEDLGALLDARIALLAEKLDLSTDRLVGWTYVRAVMAEVWNVLDDGKIHGGPLRVAKALEGRCAPESAFGR